MNSKKGSTKRTFIAIELTEALSSIVDQIVSSCNSLSSAVRFIHRTSGLHLTLKFLGETDVSLIPEIGQILEQIIDQTDPFSVQVNKTGVFPGARRPSIFWLGISEGAEELSLLARRINKALEPLGFVPEKRAFHPHVTIGRLKKGHSRVKGLKEFLSFHYEPLEIAIKSVYFFESILLPSGAKYIKLREFEL